LLGIIGLLFYKYVIVYSTLHRRYFKDKNAQKLCLYARHGKTDKIKQLLKDSVDINTQGKEGVTPLTWLMIFSFATEKTLRGFKYLLENGADPLVIFKKADEYNAFQIACMLKNPKYLETILDVYKPTKEELNITVKYSHNPPLDVAIFYNRFEQFKILTDYGADVNWSDSNNRNLLSHNGYKWKYAYHLLKAGADWKNVSKFNKEDFKKTNIPDYIARIEREKKPSLIIAENNGVDYFQKVISFLKKQGAEFKLNLNSKEEYRNIDGREVLFIKEDNNWIEYKKSNQYKKDLKMFRPTIMERIGEFFGIM
jgi:ankyrin repeat protein